MPLMYIVGAQEAQITKIAKTVILIQGYERTFAGLVYCTWRNRLASASDSTGAALIKDWPIAT